jgi:hypothetical protein
MMKKDLLSRSGACRSYGRRLEAKGKDLIYRQSQQHIAWDSVPDADVTRGHEQDPTDSPRRPCNRLLPLPIHGSEFKCANARRFSVRMLICSKDHPSARKHTWDRCHDLVTGMLRHRRASPAA